MTPLWTGGGLRTLEGEHLLVWGRHQSPVDGIGGGVDNGQRKKKPFVRTYLYNT